MQKIKLLALLIFSFIVINAGVYYFSQENENERIEIALADNLSDLETHYGVLIHNQKLTADAVAISTIKYMPNVTKIMKKAIYASKQEKVILRKKLQKLLTNKYDLLKMKGVLQYHFVLPNNESFLRMHKIDKFGDDLTNIRADFKYVNEMKVPIHGFTQGRTAHGFRNTYPIINDEGEHLGAIEISFSSDSFQEYLTKISKIHTHFLVDKNIFDSNAWKRDDLIVKYTQSAEHKDFMLAISKNHSFDKCVTQTKKNFANKQNEIKKGVKSGKKFSVYTIVDKEHVIVASYFPIKNLADTKALAWIVSYEESPFIYKSIQSAYLTRVSAFILFLIIAFLLYKLKENEYKIQIQADTDILTGVYNRSKFDKILSYELSRNIRYKSQLCLAILDIDFFKKFNDEFGHLIGDEVLICLAKEISTSIRETDTFARWGGEEFILLFPETSLSQANIICNKLRQNIQNNPHHSAGTITASFGLTAYKPHDTIDTLFKRCDEALYLAKDNGRNNVYTKL